MALHQKTIDDFCRLCAVESQSGVTIYSAEGEHLCLEEKIISCLRIEVSRDDMLPKKVCQSCSTLLEDYHQFTERANQVQQTLGFLLGLQLRHMQEQEAELCLLESNVKLEANLIKNELDEMTVQQGSLQVENEKYDLGTRHMLGEEEDYNSNSGLGGNLSPSAGDGTVRQIHRRKMLQPKKAAAPDKNSVVQPLAEIEGVDCLLSKNNSSNVLVTEEDFKPEDFGTRDEFDANYLFQDLDDEDDNIEEVVDPALEKNIEHATDLTDNSNEDIEAQVEKEWQKHWGITCDQCQMIFPHKSLFDQHYTVMYNKEPVYTCSYCKKSMDKYSTYRSHCYRHIYDGRYKCKFCDKRFCMQGILRLHILSKHAPVRPFICEECGKGFVTQPRLSLHQKKHRNQNKEEFKCLECGKILQTRGGLSAHLTVHKLGRRFMCDLCGKTFTQKINMKQHVKHHKGERPFPCNECGKCFAEKSLLNRHKSYHTLDRPFQCPVCKKMYKTERCLKVHSMVHLNNRPYVCSYCGKGFLSSTKLKQHYNCHTGERPYSCKYCERTFTNYPNWLKHTRRRHKVDHKTGLSLKEDITDNNSTNSVSVIKVQQEAIDNRSLQSHLPELDMGRVDQLQISNGNIEFIEIPDVEVKVQPSEDGRDSEQPETSMQNHQSQLVAACLQSSALSLMSPFPVHSNPTSPFFHLNPPTDSNQAPVFSEHVMSHVMSHHMMTL